jgi:hypothetical protein
MTGTQDFIGKSGEIAGSLGFGTLIAIIGIKAGFIVIGIAAFALGSYLFVKKLIRYHHISSEREAKADRPVHDLGVPISDIPTS